MNAPRAAEGVVVLRKTDFTAEALEAGMWDIIIARAAIDSDGDAWLLVRPYLGHPGRPAPDQEGLK
jgi:hypothetical protein